MKKLIAERLVVRRGGSLLIDDLSLSFGPTGAVALIGPNGAGKSTLLKMLAGIERPDAGRVLLQGADLARMNDAARAREIGFMPQHFEPHWDLSVRELLRLGAERGTGADAGSLTRTAKSFELEGFLSRRWSTLSGGERARVLLATILATDPPVLLADEPAASLDIRHRLDVMHALAARGHEKLSIVVVHDLDLAFACFDRVVVIDAGRVAADASSADLVGDPCLDAAFGVRFERIRSDDGWMLRAHRL